MDVLQIHHVAFAHGSDVPVPRILEEALGLKVAYTEHGDGFIERMVPVGEGYLQLLEATSEGTVRRFVERRGSALHHVAFAVPDVGAAMVSLESAGVGLVDRVPRPGAMGTTIAFVHPAALGGMLVELVQSPQHG
jgi:methylmalonyl-CoA/ethylmalonyl-CoA epimerase